MEEVAMGANVESLRTPRIIQVKDVGLPVALGV
jgi:hypothetical protein